MDSIRSFQDFYGTAHGHKKCLYWVLLKTYKKWQNLLKKANPFFLWDGSDYYSKIYLFVCVFWIALFASESFTKINPANKTKSNFEAFSLRIEVIAGTGYPLQLHVSLNVSPVPVFFIQSEFTSGSLYSLSRDIAKLNAGIGFQGFNRYVLFRWGVGLEGGIVSEMNPLPSSQIGGPGAPDGTGITAPYGCLWTFIGLNIYFTRSQLIGGSIEGYLSPLVPEGSVVPVGGVHLGLAFTLSKK